MSALFDSCTCLVEQGANLRLRTSWRRKEAALGTLASVFQLERLRKIVERQAWSTFAFHQCDFNCSLAEADALGHRHRRSFVFMHRLARLRHER